MVRNQQMRENNLHCMRRKCRHFGSFFVYLLSGRTPVKFLSRVSMNAIPTLAVNARFSTRLVRRATLFASALVATANISAQTVVLPKAPVITTPASELKIPGPATRNIALGDLIVTKAEARVYPAAAAGLTPPKVQVRVNYCVKNKGLAAVNGPIRAKFYWSSIGPFSATPAIPGMDGNLFDTTGTLNGGAEHCGMMTLNFASAAALSKLGVLTQNPTVGAWAQGSNEGTNPSNGVANNTKSVTVISSGVSP
jgi:hypothetical protein